MSISRRTFIASAASAAAYASTGSVEENVAPIRIGIIGTGNRGTSLLNTLLQLELVEMPALCDVVEAHAKAAQQIIQEKTGKNPALYTQGERDYERLVACDDLDAVIIATPWDSHARIAIAAMRAGKAVGVEVPAAITVDECWQLVRTSRETKRPCMMLENVCYFEEALAILRMTQENLFGELLHCEAGYQHDCRFILTDDTGKLTWRGEFMAKYNGNQYPTHPIGPIAQWLGLNRGDRFTQISSVSSAAKGMREFFVEKFGPAHELARRDYAQGDVNTTILRTEKGRTVVLYFDLMTHRPYDLIFRVQGVNGLCVAAHDKACIRNVTDGEEWAAFQPLMKKYAHPLWTQLEQKAKESGGHGGADYITLHEFLRMLRTNDYGRTTNSFLTVYDAATWSTIVPLSIESVAQSGRFLDFPDFTEGKWKEGV